MDRDELLGHIARCTADLVRIKLIEGDETEEYKWIRWNRTIYQMKLNELDRHPSVISAALTSKP